MLNFRFIALNYSFENVRAFKKKHNIIKELDKKV